VITSADLEEMERWARGREGERPRRATMQRILALVAEVRRLRALLELAKRRPTGRLP
jgi:hypothetical protein